MRHHNTILNRKLKFVFMLFILTIVFNTSINLNTFSTTPFISNKDQSNIVDSLGGFKQDTSTSTLFINGKLSFIYIGGEYCPYCAMERWAIVTALQQFGNFSALGNFTSAESNIATYDFIGSNYSSNIVNFQPVETWDNTAPPNQKPLQSLNNLQNSLYKKYGSSAIPFMCIGGFIFQSGAGASLNINSFSGVSFNTIYSQVASKSGSLYNEIKTESDYMVSLINQSYNNPQIINTTSSTTTSSSTTFNNINTKPSPGFTFLMFINAFTLIPFFSKVKKH